MSDDLLDLETPIISVGDIVHYHPDENTRLAAFVVNGRPFESSKGDISTLTDEQLASGDLDENTDLPELDLQVCNPDGKIKFIEKVPPFIPSTDPDQPSALKGTWTRKNEVNIEGHTTELIHQNLALVK